MTFAKCTPNSSTCLKLLSLLPCVVLLSGQEASNQSLALQALTTKAQPPCLRRPVHQRSSSEVQRKEVYLMWLQGLASDPNNSRSTEFGVLPVHLNTPKEEMLGTVGLISCSPPSRAPRPKMLLSTFSRHAWGYLYVFAQPLLSVMSKVADK